MAQVTGERFVFSLVHGRLKIKDASKGRCASSMHAYQLALSCSVEPNLMGSRRGRTSMGNRVVDAGRRE